MPVEFLQLGVAGVVATTLAYVFKLVVDGRLHTDGEITIRDKRTEELLAQVKTLTDALSASNEQSRAIISLWKALQSRDDDE
jgi:hypothetical protein